MISLLGFSEYITCDVVFVGGDGGALVVEDLPAGGGSVPEGAAAG